MFAVIKTGGKQYFVHPGDKIKIEKLEIPEGREVVFDQVLLVSDKKIEIGTPYISGYTAQGKILRQGKGEKVIVYKYKPKKRYHKKQGHRQLYTEVEILSINASAVAGQAIGVKKVERKSSPAGETKRLRASTKARAKTTVSTAKKKVQTATKRPAAKKRVLTKSKK